MKIYKFILLTTILATLLTVGICAKDTTTVSENVYVELEHPTTYIPDVSGDAVLADEGFEEYILDCLLDVKTEINVGRFNIPVSNVAETTDVYTRIIYTNYEVYYALTGFEYNYYIGSETLAFIYPIYTTTNKNEIAATVKAIESRIDSILSYTDDDMTDIQKLITVYDRLILESEYDTSYNRRSIKDILIDRTAVCAGYASAMYALADELDIPCGFVRSDEMTHVWNILYIDGEWYHADATWDDPTTDKFSRVQHKHFLKSDDWMVNHGGHRGFEPVNADSEIYDDAFWNNVYSSIITLDEKMYCIYGENGDYSFCYFDENECQTKLYSFREKWYSSPSETTYWTDAYSGLCHYDGRFYFNTAGKIISVDENGNDSEVIYTLEDGRDLSIYGCFSDGNIIRFGTGKKNAPNSNKPLDRHHIEIEGQTESDYIVGDLTGDESVDMNDAILLLQYSMFPSLYPIEYAGSVDYTEDGEIDMNDAILLLQHSMFPTLYPLPESNNTTDTDTLFCLTGESFTGDEFVWGENNTGITVVENPDDESDEVLYLEANITDRQSWNYFWHPFKWVPGERYLISFSARVDCDALGYPVDSGFFGINVRTNAVDKCVGSVYIEDEWSDINLVYTIPDDVDVTKDMKFGIFVNPIESDVCEHYIACSYYLDNISISLYDGDAPDGFII